MGPSVGKMQDPPPQVVDPYLPVAVIDDVLFRCIVLVCGTGARPVYPCFLLVGFSNHRAPTCMMHASKAPRCRPISLPNHYLLGALVVAVVAKPVEHLRAQVPPAQIGFKTSC